MKICEWCLEEIQSREGPQYSRSIYVDEKDAYESTCDLCGQYGFDCLYEVPDSVEGGFVNEIEEEDIFDES